MNNENMVSGREVSILLSKKQIVEANFYTRNKTENSLHSGIIIDRPCQAVTTFSNGAIANTALFIAALYTLGIPPLGFAATPMHFLYAKPRNESAPFPLRSSTCDTVSSTPRIALVQRAVCSYDQ